MLNLDELKDKLNTALDKETADSLSEWLNNKRNMNEEQIARIQLINALDNIQSIMHDLTLGEMDELIDELTVLYERYSDYVDMREGEKPE